MTKDEAFEKWWKREGKQTKSFLMCWEAGYRAGQEEMRERAEVAAMDLEAARRIRALPLETSEIGISEEVDDETP